MWSSLDVCVIICISSRRVIRCMFHILTFFCVQPPDIPTQSSNGLINRIITVTVHSGALSRYVAMVKIPYTLINGSDIVRSLALASLRLSRYHRLLSAMLSALCSEEVWEIFWAEVFDLTESNDSIFQCVAFKVCASCDSKCKTPLTTLWAVWMREED